MSTVSVVIPAYNAEKYLKECVESILNQSEKVDEIIIINDGSTDNTDLICGELASQNSIVCYYKQENKGVAYTRNYGVKLAKSDYVMFVDSDDVLPNGSIESLKKQTEEGCDFVLGGYASFSSKDGILSVVKCDNFEGSMVEFVKVIDKYMQPPLLLGPCFKLFKRELIVNGEEVVFPEDLSYGEDAIFVMKFLKHVHTVKCVDQTTYLYRKDNEQSLSSKYREDKIDINMSIADLFGETLKVHGCENLQASVNKCRLNYFDAFTTDLMRCALTYKKRREIYVEKSKKHDAIEIYKNAENLGFKQKLRKGAIKSKFLFRLMSFLYSLQNKS